jgi:hypothetical protein
MIVEITPGQTPKKIIVTAPPSVTVTTVLPTPKTVTVSVFRDGEKGLSAYEIAVLNGFVGDEPEWLDSMKGLSAYQIAVALGFPGTEAQWIESLSANCNWGAIGGEIADQADLMAKLDLKINRALIGAANGIAPVGEGGTIALQYFPDEVLGNVKFRGTYNGVVVSSASVTYNGLPLPNPVSQNAGIYFIVTAPFTNAAVDYSAGDWILSLGSTGYSKVDNSDSVTSVFGRLGNILALEGDYAAFYPLLSATYNNPVWIGTLAKSKVGLGNVDNTSDVNKPVSTAQAAAIALKADKSSFICLDADFSLTNTLSLQSAFGKQFNLLPGLYKYDGYIYITGVTASASSALFGFLGTAAFTLLYGSEGVKGTATVVASQGAVGIDATATIVTSQIGTAARVTIKISGTMRITAGGSIIAAVGNTFSQGNNQFVMKNSWFIMDRLGGAADVCSADVS